MRVSWSICAIGAAVSGPDLPGPIPITVRLPGATCVRPLVLGTLHVRVLNNFRWDPRLFSISQQLIHACLVWDLDGDLGLSGSVCLAYPRRCHAST